MHPRSKLTLARYRFGAFVLDPAKRELQRDGVTLVLPARAFECLHYLIEHRDRAVGRDELVHAVFSRADVSDAQLAQVVLRTRRAIGDDGQEQRAIRTVPRFGFRWAEPVTIVDDDGTAPAPEVDAVELRDEPLPSEHVVRHEAPTLAAPEATDLPLREFPAVPAMRRTALATVGRVVMDCGVAVAAMLALTISLLPWPTEFGLTDAQAQSGTPNAIIVLPMQVSGPDDAAWARLGMMDFVVDRLRRASLPVMSSEATLSLLRSQEGKGDPQRLHKSTRAGSERRRRATTSPMRRPTSPERGSPVYGGMTGTSMAAPHVAATVALMQSVAGTPLTPAQVEATLKATARPFPVAIPTYSLMGAGILNAKAALATLVPCQGPDCEANARPLTNRVPVRGLSGATGSEQLFALSVPVGATIVSFLTYDGTGDVTLLVRYGQTPTQA